MIHTTIKQGSKEWFIKRANSISATNVSSILNVNHFKSNDKLLEEKIKKEIVKIDNKFVKHGIFFEPIAKKFYQNKTNNFIFESNLVIHKDYPWLVASPDGFVSNDRLIEIKCYYNNYIKNNIPIYYWIQMQIQMEVCNIDNCDFVEAIFKTYSKEEFQKDTIYPNGLTENVYWKLIDFKITPVKRNRKWFEINFPKIKDFYNLSQTLTIRKKNKRKRYEFCLDNYYYHKMIDNYILDDNIVDYFRLAKKYKRDHSLFLQEMKDRKISFMEKILSIIRDNKYKKINEYEQIIKPDCSTKTIEEIKKNKYNLINAILIDDDNEQYAKFSLLIMGKYLHTTLNQNSYYPVQIINKKLQHNEYFLTNSKENLKLKARACILNNILNKFQNVHNDNVSFIIDRDFVNSQLFIKVIDDAKINEIVNNGMLKYRLIKNNLHNISFEKNDKLLLLPNMNNNNLVWKSAKKQIANKMQPLTNIWNVKIKTQNELLSRNITSYNNTQNIVSNYFSKHKKNQLIQKIIDINNQSTEFILPKSFKNFYGWKNEEKLEFYLDFETLSLENFDQLLYLIGLGVKVDNEFKYHSFCINIHKQNSVENLIERFYGKMRQYESKYNGGVKAPIYHWSHAEINFLNNIWKKYPKFIKSFRFIDLQKVFEKEEIVINGVYNYKLKSIVNVLHENNKIKSNYKKETNCNSGIDALIEGYHCYMSALRMNIDLVHYLEDRNIIEYNRTDCFALYEILHYIRNI